MRDLIIYLLNFHMANNKITGNIAKRLNIEDIVERLTELPGSAFNSLLLEVFSKRVDKITPARLLQQYQDNRFVKPAATDMTAVLRSTLQVLELLQEHHFQPVELSPVAQLGSCAAVATASQQKIISALRNTEVMADATNALALHIADLKQSKRWEHHTGEELLRYCTVHQHVRAQEMKGNGFTPHFKIGCLVSSGRDTGNYRFELVSLQEHFLALHELMKKVFGIESIYFKLLQRDGYPGQHVLAERAYNHLQENMGGITIALDDTPGSNNYYKGVQFKIIIEINGGQVEIADGGFVDWTQQLLGNKKERMLISGFGLSLLHVLRERGE